MAVDSNAGLEIGYWSFQFSSNQAFAVGDEFWILFPNTFDPQLGTGYIKYTEEPTVYYIPCTSSQLTVAVECVIDRWYLRVINGTAQDASTEITLDLGAIRNPSTMNNTGDFKLFHMTSNQAKAVGTLTGLAIGAYPGNIKVKKVMNSNPRLFGTADYTLEFYVSTNLTNDHSIYLQLPR